MEPATAARWRPRARVAAVAISGVVAATLAVTLLAVTPGASRVPDGGPVLAVLLVAMGLGFVTLGSFTWRRRPENRIGLLMLAVGQVTLVTSLQISDTPLLFTIG